MKLSLMEQACDGAARCMVDRDARCVLVSAFGTRVQIACHHDHAPALIVCCNGAAMKLRLMEQACDGCSTVRGGQGLKVRARLCLLALGCRLLAASTKHLH